jgi:pyridoxamine 5'-phosphate oxidase
VAARLAGLRREYGDAGIDVGEVPADPVEAIRRWLDDAERAGIHEPNAIAVATVGPDGGPSVRMVLLKELDEHGLVFYTNYGSRKAEELDASGKASVLFPWHDLQRQVRVEGTVARVSREQSAAYWAQRPRESRLGAVASPQSREVASRAELDALYEAAEQRHRDDDVPLPEDWGGYRVVPEVVELWQGRRGRMHDRLVYRRAASGTWELSRLAP